MLCCEKSIFFLISRQHHHSASSLVLALAPKPEFLTRQLVRRPEEIDAKPTAGDCACAKPQDIDTSGLAARRKRTTPAPPRSSRAPPPQSPWTATQPEQWPLRQPPRPLSQRWQQILPSPAKRPPGGKAEGVGRAWYRIN